MKISFFIKNIFMLKKRVALFFIFSANIFLLAHVIVPHHYHNGIVCKSNILYKKNNDTQKHSNEHEIKRESDFENCLLTKAVFISSKTSRQSIKPPDSDDESLIFFHFFTNIKFASFVPAYDISPIPPFIFFPEQILNNLVGLRAPPIV